MTQTIFPSLAYEDADQAIDWLSRVFGFKVLLRVGGTASEVAHAELVAEGGHVIFLLSTSASTRRKRSPMALGGTAQSVYIAVPDLDAMHSRAVEAGARIFNPLHETPYGTSEFCCLDPEGHIWTFGTYRPDVCKE